MTTQAGPSVDLDALTKVFTVRGGPPVTSVDRVSLQAHTGRVLALLGANGAGKTTTIKMACGLVIPTAGTARIEGYDVRRARRRAVARLGVVLEGTRNLYWRLTASENLRYFGRLRGWWGRRLSERAERLLRELALWDRRDRPVQFLSRGQQQLVALAAAAIADPPVIVLDEPTLGLDAEAAARVRDWIAALAAEERKTVILTTHQLDVAQAVSDDVAIMSGGRLIAHRPLRALLAMFRIGAYRIRVKGSVANDGHPALDDWRVSEADGETVLHGHVSGAPDLYGVLEALRRQEAPLVEVAPAEPDLEAVYLRIVGAEAGVAG